MLIQLNKADQLPVSLQQVKAQLRLDHSDDDEHLIHLIKSGTAWVENYIGKCLLSQTWCQSWNGLGGSGGLCSHREIKSVFSLGKLPLLGIKSVTLVAPNNHRQDILFYTMKEEAGRVCLRLRYVLPKSHRLEIIYTAGFGDRPDDIPMDIRQALLVYVGCLYEQRTGIDRGDLLGIYGLLTPHRVMRLP